MYGSSLGRWQIAVQDSLLNEVSESAKCHRAWEPVIYRWSVAGFGGCVWMRQPVSSSSNTYSPNRSAGAAVGVCSRLFPA